MESKLFVINWQVTPLGKLPSSMQLLMWGANQTKRKAGRTTWKEWGKQFSQWLCFCVCCKRDCLTQQSVRMKFISDESIFPHFGFVFTFVKVNRPDNFFMFSPGSSHWQTTGGNETIFSRESKSVYCRAATHSFLAAVLSPYWCKSVQCFWLYHSNANLYHLQTWLPILAIHLSRVHVLPVTAVEPQCSLNALCSFRVLIASSWFLLKCFWFYFFYACETDPQL